MPLFWIVHEIDGERRVMIREDATLVFAKIKAAINGLGGDFIEAHALDAATAKRIPRKMIGRKLTAEQAAALLKRLA